MRWASLVFLAALLLGCAGEKEERTRDDVLTRFGLDDAWDGMLSSQQKNMCELRDLYGHEEFTDMFMRDAQAITTIDKFEVSEREVRDFFKEKCD